MTLRIRSALDIIEACYGFAEQGDNWLANLLEVAAPSLPDGPHAALEADIDAATLRSRVLLDREAGSEHVAVLERGHGGAPEWCVKATYGSGKSWISLREAVSKKYFARADWLEPLRAVGGGEMLGIVPQNLPENHPTCALFSLPKVPVHPSPRERKLWTHIAEHMGAAQRIRLLPDVDDDSLVLSPDGDCLHAAVDSSRENRNALRALVRRRERARAGANSDDDERRLDFWDELASGRWSLIDRFDSDGRRFVVARRNPCTMPDLRALTERERAVAEGIARGFTNDRVALELGLAPPTVTKHLKNALRKLGVQHAVELAEFISSARQ